MKRRTYLIVLGIVSFGCFLALTMPAARFYHWFGGRIPELAVYGLQGSVAKGQADLVQWNDWRLEQVDWHLHPASLLAGAIGARIHFHNPDAGGRGVLAIGLGGSLRLSDTEVQLPAASLEQALGNLPIKLGGRLRVQLEQLELADGQLDRLRGSIAWDAAELRDTPPVALGDFLLTLEPDGEAFKGTLTDQGGPLRVNGILALQKDGSYQFKGNLTVRDNQQRKLVAAIKLLGPTQADGSVAIEFEGKLPLALLVTHISARRMLPHKDIKTKRSIGRSCECGHGPACKTTQIIIYS